MKCFYKIRLSRLILYTTKMSTAPAKSSPRDAQVMAAILKDMGVTEHEPRLINQMLEFTYRKILYLKK